MKQRDSKAHQKKALASITNSETSLPSDEEIIAIVRQHGHETAQRDLARLFALKGEERRLLRQKLRQMSDKGLLARKGKRFSTENEAPEIFVGIIIHKDHYGELWIRSEDTGATNPAVRQIPSSRLILPKSSGRFRAPTVGDRVLVKRAEGGRDHAPSVKLLKTLPRSQSSAQLRRIGVIKQSTTTGTKAWFIHSTSKRSRISQWPLHPQQTQPVQDGDLVVFEVDDHRRLGPGHARIKEILKQDANEHTITTIAIHEHGLRDTFPQIALQEAQNCKPASLDGREDWRDIPLITIDPSDAKDHDDAVCAFPDTSPDNEGGYVILVAIADVATYVKAGGAMDKEALLRGNSVYFPTGVLPMLPERLANDLCSLKPDVDRPALAMRITVDKSGRKKAQSLHRILMRSHAKLSYQDAQNAFDGHQSELCKKLWPTPLAHLKNAHLALEQESASRGPLDLDLPERKLQLDETGHVTGVITPPRLMAHKLIENMMILANVAAAEMLETKGIGTVYRTHANPSQEKVGTLRQVLSSLGIHLQKAENLRSRDFNQALKALKGRGEEPLVQELVLRSQSQAVYETQNIGHFGLSLRRYAHFTSPIRRYADLIVHRQLIAAYKLGTGGDTPDTENLKKQAEDISQAERRAMSAERDTYDRLIAGFMEKRVGETMAVRVVGVVDSGIFVREEETGADGYLPLNTYNTRRGARRGLAKGREASPARHALGYTLGDRLDARLIEAAPLAGALRFELIESKNSEDAKKKNKITKRKQRKS